MSPDSREDHGAAASRREFRGTDRGGGRFPPEPYQRWLVCTGRELGLLGNLYLLQGRPELGLLGNLYLLQGRPGRELGLLGNRCRSRRLP